MFDELHVLVVGSVFKSWNFLRPGNNFIGKTVHITIRHLFLVVFRFCRLHSEQFPS